MDSCWFWLRHDHRRHHSPKNPETKIAVIDKDDPGGICPTRGCIPSKMLLYPAELIATIKKAGELGVDVEIKKVDFAQVMERMRSYIQS